MSRNLSPNFTLEELTISQTAAREGIDNTPGKDERRNLRTLARFLEQVRSELGDQPIVINSGYRSPALNAAIKGSKTSAHMKGLAADLIVPSHGTVLQTAKAIAASGLPFDQLIYEMSWIHIGLPSDGQTPRQELLSYGAQKKYVPGLTSNC